MVKENATYLIWVDLEMSGLDVEKERILEFATIVTDGDLNIVAEGPDVVIHQPDEILSSMDSWNKDHHSRSGLIEQVRRSKFSESQAEQEILDFLKKHVKAKTVPLAGNSVHMDRLFIAKYMPKLHDFFHYRNVDVSTVKELVSRWYPVIYTERPEKRGNHRALSDIKESIDELKYYRQRTFVQK